VKVNPVLISRKLYDEVVGALADSVETLDRIGETPESDGLLALLERVRDAGRDPLDIWRQFAGATAPHAVVAKMISDATGDDDFEFALRMLIIDETDDEYREQYPMLALAITMLKASAAGATDHDRRADREYLTEIALERSLCPLHLHDYAICFDDDELECATLRMIHPSHDT
jgi:hypothetical protein